MVFKNADQWQYLFHGVGYWRFKVLPCTEAGLSPACITNGDGGVMLQ